MFIIQNLFDKKMPRKKLIVSSLYEYQKRSNNNNNITDESDSDGKKKRKRRKKVEASDSTFSCDICHFDEPSHPKYSSAQIKFLDEKEQTVLRYKKDRPIKVLCKKHHHNEFFNFFSKSRQTKCCNILNVHQKKQKSNLQDVTVQLADSVKHLGIVVTFELKISASLHMTDAL